MDMGFATLVAPAKQLNVAIEVVRLPEPIVINSSGASTGGRDIHFMVLNHANEPVVFPDRSFGMRLYVPDPLHYSWNEVLLGVGPPEQPWALPAKLESWDPVMDNTWSILAEHLPMSQSRTYRLYVSGIGSQSKEEYGAFVDIDMR